MTTPTILVTGAAGFIGSALCRYLCKNNLAKVIGLDKMTYASSREALEPLKNRDDFLLIEGDIRDAETVTGILTKYKPNAVMHLAAETHVDRSIDNPSIFIETNVTGTLVLLEGVRHYLPSLSQDARQDFRFLHVSTDEVYGSLGSQGSFTENTPYAPNSPYAASKASADFLARAWFQTFKFPVIISNCSNNYGPFQFPEKLIPLMVTKAIAGEKLPVYGKGHNVRDWLYVEDHAEALFLILTRGQLGEKYNVGGNSEWRNIDLVEEICRILDALHPQSPTTPHKKLISYVEDRPGHDERYAMDFSKLRTQLGWSPKTAFTDGLRRTVAWYLENESWCKTIGARRYSGERLGQIRKNG